ncbi:MAG: hypothetical protein JWR33_1702 [Naasia sp.]|jgi:flagellar hook-associated protein 2|uniref:flagellar filament capping protein FliD n=1 Tax=Naasia sp. TaxID=2546198 RepID=UPI00262FCF1C|nr:flagellar filament capping protein FliD [Naasia sp.]MCU1570961.1 hypothetical protein [Naasia sp.]
MAGLGIDGLSSGLDTTSIINQLMSLEARPQTMLKSSVSRTTSFANDLRALNTTVAAIAAKAKTASAATSLAVYSATSTAPGVTASARNTSIAGSISFTVGESAERQVTVSAAMAAWPSTPPTLALQASDGTTTEVTAASTAMPDIAAAINAANKGVSATVVRAGTDSGGTKLYRLQLTATASGAASAFTAYRGSAADVAGGTAVDLATESGAAIVGTARDASVTLWGDTSAEQTITSSTNVFTDLLPGLDVTVTAPEETSVTLTVSQNVSAAASVASGLFADVAALFKTIAQKTAVTVAGSTGSSSTVKGGSFTGDSTVRALKNALLDAATGALDGRSLSDIGVKITRDGTVEFDSAVFTAALQKDPAGTAARFQSVAARVEKAGTAAAEARTGYLTTKIAGQDKTVATLNDQIASWDLRLASRKATLQKQYAALETALSSMKSQSNWLASQIGSLMSTNSSS